MSTLLYILDGKQPVACADIFEWGRWMHKEQRTVAKHTFGDATISTVFLGVDYGYTVPLLFETMVFGGPHDGTQRRYSTWEQAEAGHRAMVLLVTAAHA